VSPHAVDVVTARACAPLPRLLDFAQPFLAPSTVCLFPKGERFAEELTLAREGWTMRVSVEQSLSGRRGVILRLEQVVREPRHR